MIWDIILGYTYTYTSKYIIYTRGIYTIIFVFISETYLQLYLYEYYNFLSIYTKVYVQLHEYLQLYEF